MADECASPDYRSVILELEEDKGIVSVSVFFGRGSSQPVAVELRKFKDITLADGMPKFECIVRGDDTGHPDTLDDIQIMHTGKHCLVLGQYVPC